MADLLKKLPQDKNYSLRTQISLSPTLRRMIDATGRMLKTWFDGKEK